MVSGNPAELKAYQTLVTTFEKQNPNYKVDLVHIPSSGDSLTRFRADLAAWKARTPCRSGGALRCRLPYPPLPQSACWPLCSTGAISCHRCYI